MALGPGAQGMVGGAIQSIASSISSKIQISKMNDYNRKMYQLYKETIQEQIGISYERLQEGFQDVRQNRLSTAMATKKASRLALGKKTVEAAQMGSAGVRGGMFDVGIRREEGDLLTQGEIEAASNLNAMINSFSDNALTAIINLNNNNPMDQQGPGIMSTLVDAGSNVMDVYSKLGPDGQKQAKADFSGLFKRGRT